jgi:DNA-directed RNA polymerase specialized sigma24 family protein
MMAGTTSGRSITDESRADHETLSKFLIRRTTAPWGDVIGLFWRPIASAIIKVLRRFGPPNEDDINDLMQEVYVKLCADNYRLFRECRAQHPGQLFGLVQAVATTTTLDSRKSASAERHGGKVVLIPIDDIIASENDRLTIERLLNDKLLISEIDCYLQTQSQRDRQMFWLHFRQGFTSKHIATMPDFHLTEKGVESAIRRLTKEICRIFREGGRP